jgi:hypothetical protein
MIYPVIETCWNKSFVSVLPCKVLDILPPAAVLYKHIIRVWWIEERVLSVVGLRVILSVNEDGLKDRVCLTGGVPILCDGLRLTSEALGCCIANTPALERNGLIIPAKMTRFLAPSKGASI